MAIPLDDLESPAIPQLTPGEHEDAPVLGLTLAEVLRHSGYATRGVISHLYLSAELGFDQIANLAWF